MTKCSNDACTGFAACPAGWSSGIQLEPLRSCKQCDAGQTSSAASTVCRDCTKGTFGVIDSAGAGVCASCPSGYFQPEETSATSCSRCPAGWTQESEGESSCKDLAGLKPSDCKDDEYFNVTECVDCPEGGSCVGDITAFGIRTLFGWYQCPNDALNLTYERCVFGAACLGAKNDALKGKFEIKLSNKDPALADNVAACAAPYLKGGLICASCASGYSHSGLGEKCDECPSDGDNTAVAVTGSILGVIGLVGYIQLTLSSAGKLEPADGAQSIGMSFVQVVSLLLTFPIAWSGLFLSCVLRALCLCVSIDCAC